MKITVCMATHNGAKYVQEQMQSILMQLGPNDELLVSDDASTDNTPVLVAAMLDYRVKLYKEQKFDSAVANFEFLLKKSSGDYIFLSDQDDVWMPNKVAIMIEGLQKAHLVVSDAEVVDADLVKIADSFFAINKTRIGVWANLAKNGYLGCCMAFRKEVLEMALPFPKEIPMHDIWLGNVAAWFYSVMFMPEKLIKYRRHGANASSTAEESKQALSKKLTDRKQILRAIINRGFFKK